MPWKSIERKSVKRHTLSPRSQTLSGSAIVRATPSPASTISPVILEGVSPAKAWLDLRIKTGYNFDAMKSGKATLGAVVILALAGFLPASAETLWCGAAQCRLTTPAGWTAGAPTRMPGDPIFFGANGSSKSQDEKFFFYVRHTDVSGPIRADSTCVKEAIASSLKNHEEIVDRDSQTVNGITYYVFLTRLDLGGSSYTSAECWLTIRDGRVYELWLDKKNGNAADDDGLSSIVQSLSFAGK